MSQRLQYGLSWQVARRITLKGAVQSRFRDGFSDFYYSQNDAGLELKFNGRFKFPLYFRYVARESNARWQTSRLLLLDPTVRLGSSVHWTFDFRTRFQLETSGLNLALIRFQPTATYKFPWHGRRCSWYVYEEYYLNVDRTLRRTSYNPNLASTGLVYALNHSTDLYLYYMLYSSRSRAAASWTNIHQPCVAFNMKI